jgi:hypothetical protein
MSVTVTQRTQRSIARGARSMARWNGTSHKTLRRGVYSLVVTLATTAKAARFTVR